MDTSRRGEGPVEPMGDTGPPQIPEHGERHVGTEANRLNWLRAAVLGANDGIVSVAGLVVGVAGATANRGAIFTAGVAGLVAGALSMAVGEYVSVSTQRDSEEALLDKERRELRETPEAELAELAAIYQSKGLTPEVSRQVAVQLTAHDALAAHAEVELKLDPANLTSPAKAAFASMASFTAGAILPLVTILLAPPAWRLLVTALTVVAALTVTGWLSAHLGGTPKLRAISRIVIGGALAMGITHAVGTMVGTTL